MPTDAAFAHVEDVFCAGFDDGELGAACTVVVDRRVVVDVWGGWADVARTRPWRHDTLVNAYSLQSAGLLEHGRGQHAGVAGSPGATRRPAWRSATS